MAQAKKPVPPKTTPPEVTVEDSPDVTTTKNTVEEPVIKSGFKKVKASEFRGTYKDAQFDDNGVCKNISETTLNSLLTDFPNIKLEEIK
jgi:hypothetical protein